MNLNANKLPILVPSNASSNIPSTSHHGSNQSLNIPEQQQQHLLNSPRSTLTTNSNHTDSSLLICGPTASSLAHSNPPFYGNSAANSGAGKENRMRMSCESIGFRCTYELTESRSDVSSEYYR